MIHVCLEKRKRKEFRDSAILNVKIFRKRFGLLFTDCNIHLFLSFFTEITFSFQCQILQDRKSSVQCESSTCGKETASCWYIRSPISRAMRIFHTSTHKFCVLRIGKYEEGDKVSVILFYFFFLFIFFLAVFSKMWYP